MWSPAVHRISTGPDNRCAGDARLEIYNDDFSAVIAQAEGGVVGLCGHDVASSVGSYWLFVYAGDEAIEDYDVDHALDAVIHVCCAPWVIGRLMYSVLSSNN